VPAISDKLRTLFNRLAPPLRPLERELIVAVAAQLNAGARELLNKQVEQINLVQRHDADKEVNFYSMKGGKPAFDEISRFPTKQEVKLATVKFKAGENKVCATFWLVHGHLFSIEFDKSPKKLRDDAVEIQEVKILIDPMIADTSY
jgi:hypothetical protein